MRSVVAGCQNVITNLRCERELSNLLPVREVDFSPPRHSVAHLACRDCTGCQRLWCMYGAGHHRATKMLLCVLALFFGISSSDAQDVIGPINDAIAADTRAIDALFLNSSCSHVYLDLGTNRAVQIRKLYQPHLYPNATVLPRFDQLFGSAPRCHVCAIGFEPNPHHSKTLDGVEKSLQAAGAPVLIFRAAASDADSIAKFAVPSSQGSACRNLHGKPNPSAH